MWQKICIFGKNRVRMYSIIYPHLHYCGSIWGSTYMCQSNLKRLIILYFETKILAGIISRSTFNAHANTTCIFRLRLKIINFENVIKLQNGLSWLYLHTKIAFFLTFQCAIPENIHISPMEGILSKTPHSSGNSNWASYISLNVLALQNPPPPRKFHPFCRGTMDIFWNCTITIFVFNCDPHLHACTYSAQYYNYRFLSICLTEGQM